MTYGPGHAAHDPTSRRHLTIAHRFFSEPSCPDGSSPDTVRMETAPFGDLVSGLHPARIDDFSMMKSIRDALLRTRTAWRVDGIRRRDVRAAAPHLAQGRQTARLQEAVAIVMLSDIARWNRRLSETLTPHSSHIVRKVEHDLRVPSATDLAHTVLAGRELPKSNEKCRIIVPIAFKEKGVLLPGFNISSSHEPITILNLNDGKAFTRRIMNRLIGETGESTGYFKDASWALARVLKDHYVQFVEIEARLGEVITIEYTVRVRHLEASHSRIAAWRLALGWKQNRFRHFSDLHNNATSYHFHFEVPDGFTLKDMRLRSPEGGSAPKYVFSGGGTPIGHIYIRDQSATTRRGQFQNEIFIDCFEAPPGSQGYTAVIGCVMTTILIALMAALSFGWFIDETSGKMQATGAIALIAGGPAVVTSILPFRNDQTSAIRPPLTARAALWSSFAMSAFVALGLSTQGFGLDLTKLKDTNLILCFLKGWVTTVAIVALLVTIWRAVRSERFWSALVATVGIAGIELVVLLQPGDVSAPDIFFSAVVPIYTLIWLRSAFGWLKAVHLSSDLSMIHKQRNMVS